MNNGRELLELAAKAVGIYGEWVENSLLDDYYKLPTTGFLVVSEGRTHVWNPLTSSGDALRLAVSLHLCLLFPMQGERFKQCGAGQVGGHLPACMEPHDPDPHAATRRAIVRAAADIGRQMQEGGA